MRGSLLDEGAFALSRLALENAQASFVNVAIDPDAKWTAAVALLATPRARSLIKEIRTRHLAVAAVAAEARPYIALMLRRLRRTIFELRRADLTYSKKAELTTTSDIGECTS